jgi:N-acetylneuraminic acid mutarotase
MTMGRRVHTLTTLLDGSVLAAGGAIGSLALPVTVTDTAERYDPKTGSWQATATPMTQQRSVHSATLLSDGRVLVCGGTVPRERTTRTVNTAEIYDPEHDTWTRIAAMTDERCNHQAVVLPDNRVLMVGGVATTAEFDSTELAFCEIFDPETTSWSTTGTMAAARGAFFRAVLLPDGTVLAIGGSRSGVGSSPVYDAHSYATTERWSPVTGQWTAAAPMPVPRSRFQAVTLLSGKVLVFGGADDQSLNAGYASTLVYDHVTDSWSSTGPMITGRFDFGATRLTDGRVLVAGGDQTDLLVPTAEVYTP